MAKARRVMLMIFAFLVFLFLTMVLLLWIWSPGTPLPFTGADGKPLPGSIAEKIFVDINGARQGLFIKGRDRTKPVLLYVHGGIPDYFLTAKYPVRFEEDFVVAWWEQRGNGISYHPHIQPASITTEVLVADIITLTNYLQQRFGNEKIYLMGHSGGTFLAIQAVVKAPQLFAAYIGIAQISNQLRSEKLAYDFMLARFKEKGNHKMVRKLEAAPFTLESGAPKEYLALRDGAMHSLGIGTMHNMRSIVSGLFIPSLLFREYTLKEKFNLWRSKAGSGVSIVWNDILKTDLNKAVPEVAVPVYFFEGIHDYTCSYTEAKSYFSRLKAPVKGFYTFAQSAHSPLFEEPGKVQRILREDVLRGVTNLADDK